MKVPETFIQRGSYREARGTKTGLSYRNALEDKQKYSRGLASYSVSRPRSHSYTPLRLHAANIQSVWSVELSDAAKSETAALSSPQHPSCLAHGEIDMPSDKAQNRSSAIFLVARIAMHTKSPPIPSSSGY